MATSEPGFVARWFAERLRHWSAGAAERPSPDDEVPHRGTVITVCILASVLLWFTFAMRETYTRTIDFPIEIQNLADEQALSERPPTSLRAQVEGAGIQLLRLYYNPPVIPVDASQALIDLEIVAPEVVQGVRLEAVTPRSITLLRERRERRRVPVRVEVDIITAQGHHVVGAILADPDSVDVEGAASIIRRIDSWPTRSGSIETDNDTLDTYVPVSDSLQGLVLVDVERIRLRASLSEFTQVSRLVDVDVVGAPPGQRVSLEPSTVRVTFLVPLRDFQAANETADLHAFVPYRTIRNDTTGAVRPELFVPADLLVRGTLFDPPQLRYYDVVEFQ